MALLEKEAGVAAVAVAAAVSPRVRGALRQGAVYGLAGVMRAGDIVVSTAKGAARGAQAGVSGENGSRPARSTPRSSASRARKTSSSGSSAARTASA
jgi:hypothetical protein